MVEKLKKLRLHITISAVLTLVLGVILILYPADAVMFIAKVVGAIIAVVGIVMLLGSIFGSGRSKVAGIISGCIVALIGGWVVLNPASAASIIPMIIGVFLVVHGAQDLVMAFSMKSARGARWWLAILIGVLDVILGAVCVTSGFGVVSVGMMFIGFMLVYDGVSSMLVVHRVNSAERKYVDGTVISEEDI